MNKAECEFLTKVARSDQIMHIMLVVRYAYTDVAVLTWTLSLPKSELS